MDIVQARQAIAAILSRLEKSSGQLVRSISVTSIEVTQFQDHVPQHQMMVEIELERLPGHQW